MEKGFTIWLTGLSGSGKSTIARELERQFKASGHSVEVLDGDEIRKELNYDLGFSKEDRDKNIKRIAFLSKILSRNSVIVIAAAISPYRELRDYARNLNKNFVEVFVDCPLAECERRDTKGMYAAARRGELKDFTGINDPYEQPLNAEVVVHTNKERVSESTGRIMDKLDTLGFIQRATGSAYGGRLVNRTVPKEEKEDTIDKAKVMPWVAIDNRIAADIELIANGAFSPLEGFMCRADYESVLKNARLSSGLPWAIPIVLPVSLDVAEKLEIDESIALKHDGKIIAVMELADKFPHNAQEHALCVYGTVDVKHPGVKALIGNVLLGGRIRLLELPKNEFREYILTPAQVRSEFKRRGWKTVAAFQTRNAPHRAHEHLQMGALKKVDGLFINPVIGERKAGDTPAGVILEAYKLLIDKYYPKGMVFLSALPMAMRYAGPKEAIHHAIIRRNYGCTHFIAGRDHAGVGGYYSPFAAHDAVFALSSELGVIPIFSKIAYYCKGCGKMLLEGECAHGQDMAVTMSGSEIRAALLEGRDIDERIIRPEIVRIMRQSVPSPRNLVE